MTTTMQWAMLDAHTDKISRNMQAMAGLIKHFGIAAQDATQILAAFSRDAHVCKTRPQHHPCIPCLNERESR